MQGLGIRALRFVLFPFGFVHRPSSSFQMEISMSHPSSGLRSRDSYSKFLSGISFIKHKHKGNIFAVLDFMTEMCVQSLFNFIG